MFVNEIKQKLITLLAVIYAFAKFFILAVIKIWDSLTPPVYSHSEIS